MDSLPQVWSCGGGRQSVAIAALIVQGKLPVPDWSCIVDTGREKSSTWKYMDAVLIPELAKVGVTLHRIDKKEYATVDLYSFNDEHLLIPAFTNQSGSIGKLTNFCSGEWKKRSLARFLRAQGVGKYVAWIGFSLNETRRVLSIMDGQEYTSGLIRLPLVHDVPMRATDCASLVRDMGWPDAPRSACWMCPNQSDDEWRGLTPAEFAKAIELDRFVRDRDPNAFLHASCKPLDQVDFSDEGQPSLFEERACLSGMCFV